MNDDIAIKVTGLRKSFKLPTEKSSSLKQSFFNLLRGKKGYKKLEILKGIDFEIKKNEFVGIVGRNGSGKSTLLKILSNIYEPNSGKVEINGALVPFIELGVGFNPELTGRENIYLNGALLGFSNKEIDKMYDEIVDFSELRPFMDQKLKNYSSGMQVRLAFSIAVRAKGDILVLDEVLAVGDESFQEKCKNYFRSLKGKQTIVLVSHSMETVRQFCDRAIMIKDGKVVMDGSPEDAANLYSLENVSAGSSSHNSKDVDSAAIRDLKIKLLSPKCITQDDKVKIEVSYTVRDDIDTYLGLTLWDINRGQSLINTNSKQYMNHGPGKQKTSFEFDISKINDTDIRINVSVRDEVGKILEYCPDEFSPVFIFRRDDYVNMKNKTTSAVLFERGKINNGK